MTTANIFSFSDTWNNISTTFNGIKLDVTDSASADASKLVDLQVGSVSQFAVGKDGSITFAGTLKGIEYNPSGAVIGQALGFPSSTTVLEPYTPAGAGDTLKAANEPLTGYWSAPALILNSRAAEPATTAAGQIAYSDGTDSTNGFGTHAGFQVFDGTQWSPLTHAEPLEGYGAGAGRGTASADQTAIAAAAAAGAYVELKADTTYYMTAGVTPVDGFGVHFNPGSKIVLVTQASGSGSAGFKNYSGLAANRNAAASVAFMCTVDNGSFHFTGDVWFEGDGNNQPILRPIYASNCYLYIPESFTVRNIDTCNGALSLNAMRGGRIGDVDVRGSADMVDASYTDLTNYSPTGIVFDDDGTFRSSRMIFGNVLVADLNRDAGGADPYESDAVTLGGIDKSVRSGTEEGHIFGVIRAENVGEAFDCFQDNCYVEAVIGRSLTNFGVKFIHGAQNNIVNRVDIDGYRVAGILFAGSGTSARHCDSNKVLGGRIAGADASNADAAPVHLQDNGAGTASVPKRNLVDGVEFFGESTSEYVLRNNMDATTAGAIAAGEENRIINSPNLGDAPNVSYAKNDEGGMVWDAASEFGDILERASATQRGQVELATNAEVLAGTDTERAVTPAGLQSRFDSPTFTSGVTYSDDAAALVFDVRQDTPYATSSGVDDVISQTTYRLRDSGETLQTVMQEFVRGENRGPTTFEATKRYRMFQGASFRDHRVEYDGFDLGSGGIYAIGGTQVVGAQQSAIADLSVTFTANAPAAADGSITVADGSAPTNAELLEYCAENDAKIDSILAALRAHGLIAT